VAPALQRAPEDHSTALIFGDADFGSVAALVGDARRQWAETSRPSLRTYPPTHRQLFSPAHADSASPLQWLAAIAVDETNGREMMRPAKSRPNEALLDMMFLP
jgi:hypothetical protein